MPRYPARRRPRRIDGVCCRHAGALEVEAMPVTSTRTEPAPPAPPADGNGAVPPLGAGDRLTARGIQRRYEAMPHLKKAELIEGVVYMPSPVRCEVPRRAAFDSQWLALHLPARTPGSGERRQLPVPVRPDQRAAARLRPVHRRPSTGAAVRNRRGWLHQPCPGTRRRSRRQQCQLRSSDKLAVYRRNMVSGEYIVWRVFDRSSIGTSCARPSYQKLTPVKTVYCEARSSRGCGWIPLRW